jgi:hypothetical protein
MRAATHRAFHSRIASNTAVISRSKSFTTAHVIRYVIAWPPCPLDGGGLVQGTWVSALFFARRISAYLRQVIQFMSAKSAQSEHAEGSSWIDRGTVLTLPEYTGSPADQGYDRRFGTLLKDDYSSKRMTRPAQELRIEVRATDTRLLFRC